MQTYLIILLNFLNSKSFYLILLDFQVLQFIIGNGFSHPHTGCSFPLTRGSPPILGWEAATPPPSCLNVAGALEVDPTTPLTCGPFLTQTAFPTRPRTGQFQRRECGGAGGEAVMHLC